MAALRRAQIAAGTITADKLAPGVGGSGGGWNLTGNAGLDPAVNFLGTTDLQPLLLKVNSLQAFSLTRCHRYLRPGGRLYRARRQCRRGF